jgi:uncharacterized membrane protein
MEQPLDPQAFIAAESRTTHARAIAKAVTWRALGSLDTMLIGWLITGSLAIGGSIAVLEVVTKMFLYYGHERVWSVITWGVKPLPTTPAQPPTG